VAGAAATQIYTMSSGSACQQTVIRAAPDSTLCWMPGPQILFAGARYCQSTRVELARGAFVMLSEVLVAGRLARGECWRFDRCENTVEIVDQRGELLAAEHTLIEPSRRSPALPGVMGSFAVLGSLWLLGDRFNAEHTAQVISAKGGSISAAVLPGRCGVGVRVLGAGLTAVRQALQRCYDSLAAEGLAPAGPGIPW
jgi:urease accessory protein